MIYGGRGDTPFPTQKKNEKENITNYKILYEMRPELWGTLKNIFGVQGNIKQNFRE